MTLGGSVFPFGKQKSPVEKSVLKLHLFLNGWDRAHGALARRAGGVKEERREKQEKPKLQKMNICGLAISL